MHIHISRETMRMLAFALASRAKTDKWQVSNLSGTIRATGLSRVEARSGLEQMLQGFKKSGNTYYNNVLKVYLDDTAETLHIAGYNSDAISRDLYQFKKVAAEKYSDSTREALSGRHSNFAILFRINDGGTEFNQFLENNVPNKVGITRNGLATAGKLKYGTTVNYVMNGANVATVTFRV